MFDGMFDGMFDDEKFVVEYNYSIDGGKTIVNFTKVFDIEDDAVKYIMEELKPNLNISSIHLYHNNEEIPISYE